MDISSIRKANLIKLVDKYGSQKGFAEAVNTAAAYLSQIANGTIGKNGKPASMGTGLARKIETKLNLEYGYMDHTHDEVDSSTQKLDNNLAPVSPSQSDSLGSSPRSPLLDRLIKKLELLDQSQSLTEEEIKLLQQTVDVLSKSKQSNSNDQSDGRLSIFRE